MKSCVPPPVMLNGWKHHLGFVVSKLRDFKERKPQDFEAFILKLKMLGESQFDLYTGFLTHVDIAKEAIIHLETRTSLDPHSYKAWLSEGQTHYKEVMFSDQSNWTFLEGDDESYFIHIHPSRHSKHSCRMKANHFRSALGLLAYAVFKKQKPDLELLNRLRKDYLDLSVLTPVYANSIFETAEFIMDRSNIGNNLNG